MKTEHDQLVAFVRATGQPSPSLANCLTDYATDGGPRGTLADANENAARQADLLILDELGYVLTSKLGSELPRELRFTALGGLSITPTSKLIELNRRVTEAERWVIKHTAR